MAFSQRLAWLACVALASLWACSGGGGDGGTGGAAGGGATGNGGSGTGGGGTTDCTSIKDKTISQLTDTELGTMCDCVAEILGGYAQEIDCGNGVIIGSNKNQKECVDSLKPKQASCAVLVDVALTCATDTKACDLTSSSCLALSACS